MLTNQRLLFSPHKLDNATGGSGWECALESISNVSMSARGRNPFNGSMRRRLQIDCGDVTDYFVVNNGTAVVSAIQRAAAS